MTARTTHARIGAENEIQLARERIRCRASVLHPAETARIWKKLCGIYGGYERYRELTRRELTIFRLSAERSGEATSARTPSPQEGSPHAEAVGGQRAASELAPGRAATRTEATAHPDDST